jgi:hypothetical protein
VVDGEEELRDAPADRKNKLPFRHHRYLRF